MRVGCAELLPDSSSQAPRTDGEDGFGIDNPSVCFVLARLISRVGQRKTGDADYSAPLVEAKLSLCLPLEGKVATIVDG